MTKVKICGLKSLEDIAFVNQAQPDYIGFVFAKSKRRIDYELASILKTELNKNILAVGVFVNEDIDVIKRLCDDKTIDMVQLHGDENDDYLTALKKQVTCPIIKAVRVQKKIEATDYADYMLFDTYNKNEYGGTGDCFDWNHIKEVKQPFFLAGGLHLGNIATAINAVHPFCVDISTAVEISGVKDKQKIIDIVNLVRSVGNEQR